MKSASIICIPQFGTGRDGPLSPVMQEQRNLLSPSGAWIKQGHKPDKSGMRNDIVMTCSHLPLRFGSQIPSYSNTVRSPLNARMDTAAARTGSGCTRGPAKPRRNANDPSKGKWPSDTPMSLSPGMRLAAHLESEP